MTYKHIAIIALVLMLACVIPASAVWSNGNYVPDDEYSNMTKGDVVKFDPVTGVLSKYNDSNAPDLMTYQGHVYGNLKSGGVLEGGTRFLIHRDGTPENVTQVEYFGPDGLWDGYLPTGEYTITLPQGTGSAAGIYSDDWGYVGNIHPEETRISVKAGYETRFTFIGNSIATTRGIPKGADVDVSFGRGDIQIEWIKIVQTGQHWIPPFEYQRLVREAYTEPAYYTVESASSHQECEWHRGRMDCHTVYDGNCKKVSHGQYDFMIGSQKYKFDNHGDFQYTYHPKVSHQAEYQTVTIPGYMQPEYGFEFFLDIDGVDAEVTNPNRRPVDVSFAFDINYWIDKRPWDNNAMPRQIEKRSAHYTGTITDVTSGKTTYQGTLHPDIDGAVTVLDWNHFGMQYIPYISNDEVISTVWA